VNLLSSFILNYTEVLPFHKEIPLQFVRCFSLKFPLEKPGVVVHICNPSTQQAEAGGLRVQSLPGYIARPCLKNIK
jgi:hypothetical protein